MCVLACCFYPLAHSLQSSNNTAVAIALPTIGRDLNIPEYRLQWIISAYTLSSGCLLLFFGRLADLFGRKKAFLLGILCLGVFGLGCGFAQSEFRLFLFSSALRPWSERDASAVRVHAVYFSRVYGVTAFTDLNAIFAPADLCPPARYHPLSETVAPCAIF